MAARLASLAALAGAAAGELYCPFGAGDFNVFEIPPKALDVPGVALAAPNASSNGGVAWGNGGWTITGSYGISGQQTFNLLGGYVEFDMDTTRAHAGVNTNFYTTSPDHGRFPQYCDIQSSSSHPTCMEMDIIENNGNCLAQTTWHTWPNHDGDCDQGGCWGQMRLPGGSFHMKAEFSEDGWMTVTMNGQKIDVTNPSPSNNAKAYIVEIMRSNGAQIQSSQWVGWVPGASQCPGGGDVASSVFSVRNVRVSGTVVQGPTPARCPGAQPVAPAPEDRCAASTDEYACHYNIECIWCKTPTGPGRCTNWTSTPKEGETCDPLVGCDGHRTQSSCDGDATCKWCHAFTQGWPYCTKLLDDTAGSASCDKKPAVTARPEPPLLDDLYDNSTVEEAEMAVGAPSTNATLRATGLSSWCQYWDGSGYSNGNECAGACLRNKWTQWCFSWPTCRCGNGGCSGGSINNYNCW